MQVSPSTLYNLIANHKNLDFEFLREIKEYDFFKPLIEIEDIEANVQDGYDGFVFTKEARIQLILFVVQCYTKESPYMKINDTVNFIKNKVLTELGVSDELKDMILDYKIPALEIIIKEYIMRENDEYLQQVMIVRDLFQRSLKGSASAITAEGDIDIKKQAELYKNAKYFKNELFTLKQKFMDKEYMTSKMAQEFNENVESIKIQDLIP